MRETERGLSLILGKSVDWWQVCRKPVHIRSRHVYVRNQERAVTEVFGLIVFCDNMDDDSEVELVLPILVANFTSGSILAAARLAAKVLIDAQDCAQFFKGWRIQASVTFIVGFQSLRSSKMW